MILRESGLDRKPYSEMSLLVSIVVSGFRVFMFVL